MVVLPQETLKFENYWNKWHIYRDIYILVSDTFVSHSWNYWILDGKVNPLHAIPSNSAHFREYLIASLFAIIAQWNGGSGSNRLETLVPRHFIKQI